jgi:hypothetical protein
MGRGVAPKERDREPTPRTVQCLCPFGQNHKPRKSIWNFYIPFGSTKLSNMKKTIIMDLTIIHIGYIVKENSDGKARITRGVLIGTQWKGHPRCRDNSWNGQM